ncbi:MAG: glycosyltransferase family 39 protein [Candidatus Promineifilaceae bacterium]|nr:glycosyltransferase family 39 protein [Candidatus Promineifilaceae bacterium]
MGQLSTDSAANASGQSWSGKKTLFFLIMILLLAAGLRFWNVEHDTDLQRVFSGDARNKFERAQLLATTGEIPMAAEDRYRLYRQPYFLTGSYSIVWRLANMSGLDFSERQMRVGFNAYIILFSLATVVLVFWMAKCVLDRSDGALFAALLFAVFPVNVAGSLYVKEDIPLMFWTTAALVTMSYLVKNGQKKYYLWTGLLIGMAVATKYSALLLLGIFFLAHLFVVYDTAQGERWKAFFSWQAMLGVGLAAAAFLLVNPQVINDWVNFQKGFLYQLTYASEGHHDGTAISGRDYWWTFYLRYAIMPGISILVTLFSLGGLIFAFVKKNRPGMLIATAVLIFYLQFENSLAKPFPFFARYLHVIYPLLAVLAAYAFFALWMHLRRRPLTRALGIGLGLILVLIPLGQSTLLAAAARPDTRVLAVEWLEENLATGSNLVLNSRSYSPHSFEEGKFNLLYDSNVHNRSIEQLMAEEADYLVVSSFQYDRYRYSKDLNQRAADAFAAYQTFDEQLELVKLFQPPFSFQTYGQHNPVIKIYRIPQ